MNLFFKSLPRLFKTANKDMKRHFSMTFSSILSIAVALLLSMVMGVIAVNVRNISLSIESQMKLQITLQPSLSDQDREKTVSDISSMPGVVSAVYSSRDQELDKLIAENGPMFSQYKEANPLYDVVTVEVNPKDKLEEMSEKLSGVSGVVEVSYGGPAVQKLITVFDTMRKIGFILAGGLLILSVFLIRNTVRLTILVRQDEIAIMRTVGAYNFYIYTPFLLTGMAMGMWGALIPCILVDLGYVLLYNSLNGAFVSEMFSLQAPWPFLFWLNLAAFAAGLLSGALGAGIATARLIRRTR